MALGCSRPGPLHPLEGSACSWQCLLLALGSTLEPVSLRGTAFILCSIVSGALLSSTPSILFQLTCNCRSSQWSHMALTLTSISIAW